MIKILQGNCIDKLKELDNESVQCVVTSPPYWGLRDYGTATWEGGKEDCPHFRTSHQSEHTITGQKKSVLYGGIGDSIYKSVCKLCGAKRIDQQLGLEDTPEEYVQSLVNVFREVKRVLKDDGTVWLNLGDSYARQGGDVKDFGATSSFGSSTLHDKRPKAKPPDGLKIKDLVGIPWRVAFALQDDGWYLRQDIIWAKPNPMPESVKDRCTKSHEYIFLLTKKPKYYYDADAIKEPVIKDDPANTVGGNKYPGKYQNVGTSQNVYTNNGFKNKRSVWSITVKSYTEAHFATFPTDIPEICIKASSKEGDTVLDMFAGAGTTGLVADRLGRNAILIELNKDYIKLIEDRLRNDAPMFTQIEK